MSCVGLIRESYNIMTSVCLINCLEHTENLLHVKRLNHVKRKTINNEEEDRNVS
jgi:hypothetical protein